MDVAGRRPDGSSIVAIGGEGVPDRASVVALVSDVERQHGDALLGFVRRLGIGDGLAEDLVQEALLRLYDEMLRGTSIEDPPGMRDAGFGKMYLAYLRDPDGNKLCGYYRVPADS